MPSNTPQGMLYRMRGQNTAPSDGNGSRNRVAEQQNSAASGNPYNYRGNSNMNWNQFLNGQSQNLGRYTPPTLSSMSPTSPQWNNNPGGYGYNLPTSFGGFGGFSQYEMPQQGQGGFRSNSGGGVSSGMPGSGSDAEGAMRAQAGMQDNSNSMMGQMAGMQGYASQGLPNTSALQNMLRGFRAQPPQGQRTNPYQDIKQDPNKNRRDDLLYTARPAQRQAPQPMPYTPPRRTPLVTSASSGRIDYPYIPLASM